MKNLSAAYCLPMRRIAVAFFLTIFLPLVMAKEGYAQLAIPEHGGKWVHDEAHILSAAAIAELEAILKAERDSTSNQIAVLIIPSLEGESLEDYALRVAHNEWKLGQKGKDNGVLLLISIKDRLVRTEVGYGLEGALTDAMSTRINRNEIAPRFREGDFDGGVKAGVIGIIQAIKGEYKNDNPVTQQSSRKKSKRGSSLLTMLIIMVVVFVLSRRKGGGGRGGGYWSSGAGWMGMGGGFGSSSGSSWGGGGSDFGGGGGFGGGGSSDSW